MNKKFKVITINGVRGLLMAVFVVLGLISGFIISPGWVCMKVWNYFVTDYGYVSTMNLYQGIMLWAIIALSLYAINNKRPLIAFGAYQGLSKEQIKSLVEKSKLSETKLKKDIENLSKEINKELSKEFSDIKTNIEDNVKLEMEKVETNSDKEKEEIRN